MPSNSSAKWKYPFGGGGNETTGQWGWFWFFPSFKRLMRDARVWGWDMHLNGEINQSTWAKEESARPSSWRELRAVALALLSFQRLLQGQHVQVLSGNASARAYITKQWGTRSSPISSGSDSKVVWTKSGILNGSEPTREFKPCSRFSQQASRIGIRMNKANLEVPKFLSLFRDQAFGSRCFSISLGIPAGLRPLSPF